MGQQRKREFDQIAIIRSPTQVRIAWRNALSGKTGHGDWHSVADEGELRCWVDALDRQLPTVKHRLEYR